MHPLVARARLGCCCFFFFLSVFTPCGTQRGLLQVANRWPAPGGELTGSGTSGDEVKTVAPRACYHEQSAASIGSGAWCGADEKFSARRQSGAISRLERATTQTHARTLCPPPFGLYVIFCVFLSLSLSRCWLSACLPEHAQTVRRTSKTLTGCTDLSVSVCELIELASASGYQFNMSVSGGQICCCLAAL